MKVTTIESMKDFESVIKEIGKRQEALAEEKKEIDKLVEAVSEYAVKNDLKAGEAGDYDYKLTGAPRALRALPGFKMEEIIEKFKATPETAGYVFEALDKPKLSKVFGKNQKLREEIEKYGMGFTNPELNKIKVERKED